MTRPRRTLDDISDAIADAAGALLESALQVMIEVAPDLGLSHLQVMTALDRFGPLRLIDIATALDVTPTTATRLADRLSEYGMVERVRTSKDRREIHLSLSNLGAELVDALSERRRRLLTVQLRDMSSRDQAAALELLRRIGGPPAETESAVRSVRGRVEKG